MMKPQDFDWVTAHVQCTVEGFFHHLRIEANRNCETQNQIYNRSPRLGFIENGEVFTVLRGAEKVEFVLKDDQIVVSGFRINHSIQLKAILSNTGDCVLARVGADGQAIPVERWQVLRDALTPLFFDA